jgi:DNA-binding GntR family transcriptional regulator
MDEMRNDIQQGRITQDQLRDMLEKNMSDRYKVSRDTARKARQAVLSTNVEN